MATQDTPLGASTTNGANKCWTCSTCGVYIQGVFLTRGRSGASIPIMWLYPRDGGGAPPPLLSLITLRQSEREGMHHLVNLTYREVNSPCALPTCKQACPCRYHAKLQQPNGPGSPEIQVKHQLTRKHSTEQVSGGCGGLYQRHHQMQG